MTCSSTSSRAAGSAGRSDAKKYGPRDVPPRIKTQGMDWVLMSAETIANSDQRKEAGSACPLFGRADMGLDRHIKKCRACEQGARDQRRAETARRHPQHE